MEVRDSAIDLEGTVVGVDECLGFNPIIRDSEGKEIYVFTSWGSYAPWVRHSVNNFVFESVGKRVHVQVSRDGLNLDGNSSLRFAVSRYEFGYETEEQ